MDKKLQPIKRLTCCVCGNGTYGRQWYNRDTGYGLCQKCADFVETKQSPEENHSYYGVRGIHYDLPGHKDESWEEANDKIFKQIEKYDRTLKKGYYDSV